jgi:hypothetical protein
MCWAAIQEFKERGGLRTWLFLSSGNTAEILFRQCRVRCGEIMCVLNTRLRQSVPASFPQDDNGCFDSARSADAYHVAICNTLRRSLVTPRCGHSSSCAILIQGCMLLPVEVALSTSPSRLGSRAKFVCILQYALPRPRTSKIQHPTTN